MKCFYKNNECIEAAIRAFGTAMNIKDRSNLPDRHTVRNLITKFEKEGTVHNLPKCGRPTDNSVRASVEGVFEPFVSTTEIAAASQTSQSTVWRIL